MCPPHHWMIEATPRKDDYFHGRCCHDGCGVTKRWPRYVQEKSRQMRMLPKELREQLKEIRAIEWLVRKEFLLEPTASRR